MENKKKNLWIVIAFTVSLLVNIYLINALTEQRLIMTQHPTKYPIDLVVKEVAFEEIDSMKLYKKDNNREINAKYNDLQKRWSYELDYQEGANDYVLKYSFKDEDKERVYDFTINDLSDVRYPQRRVIVINENRECQSY